MKLERIHELINSLKRIVQENNKIHIPEIGTKDQIELKSSNHLFHLDLNRNGHRKPQCTYQLREQQSKDYPLLRFDLIGRTHVNPPGDYPNANEKIPCPHLHIAHPDYGDSIAYPLNHAYAKMYLTDDELNNLGDALISFLKRCNVGNINEYTIEHQSTLF